MIAVDRVMRRERGSRNSTHGAGTAAGAGTAVYYAMAHALTTVPAEVAVDAAADTAAEGPGEHRGGNDTDVQRALTLHVAKMTADAAAAALAGVDAEPGGPGGRATMRSNSVASTFAAAGAATATAATRRAVWLPSLRSSAASAEGRRLLETHDGHLFRRRAPANSMLAHIERRDRAAGIASGVEAQSPLLCSDVGSWRATGLANSLGVFAGPSGPPSPSGSASSTLTLPRARGRSEQG